MVVFGLCKLFVFLLVCWKRILFVSANVVHPLPPHHLPPHPLPPHHLPIHLLLPAPLRVARREEKNDNQHHYQLEEVLIPEGGGGGGEGEGESMRERHKLPRLPLPHFQYKYVSGHHSNTTGRTPKSSMICVVTSVARSYPHLTTSPLFWKYALISRRICREGGREGGGRGREGGREEGEGGREGGRGREREGGRREREGERGGR